MSEHFPLWVELKISFGDQSLKNREAEAEEEKKAAVEDHGTSDAKRLYLFLKSKEPLPKCSFMMGLCDSFFLHLALVISLSTFEDMTTYYFHTIEEALRRTSNDGTTASRVV